MSAARLDAPTTTPDGAPRPAWRGRIHRYAAIASVPLFGALLLVASGGTVRLALLVYALGVTGMLGVSATYHSGRLGPVAYRRIKRVDHATILLAIAGSYTAIMVLALDGAAERRILVFVWVAAALGAAIRLAWLDAPYPLVAVVYVVVGWSALLVLGPLADALGAVDLALVLGGGVLYTVGAVVYALHRPNPWPSTFGYHEVFHALVAAAALAHYVCVARLVAAR